MSQTPVEPNASAPARTPRQRIEDALGAWAGLAWRGRWLVLALSLAATVFLATCIPSIEIKMATEDFLFEDDPVRARYEAFKLEFGQDQIANLAITPPEIFDLDFLRRLERLHDDLEEEVPFLEEVTSLVNVRSTYGRGDELVVEDLLEEMPADEAELAAWRERVLSTPLYRKTGVLSEDGRATAIRIEVAVYGEAAPGEGSGLVSAFDEDLVGGFDGDDAGLGADLGGFEDDGADFGADLGGFGDEPSAAAAVGPGAGGPRPFLSGAENVRLIEAIHRVVERHAGPDFPVHAAGGTMLTYEFTKALGRDVPLFFGGGLLVIGAILVVLFRRLAPILLCFAVVIPATLSTFGLAALLELPFSAPAQLIPSFLLAIGVSYSVHLVTIFLRDLSQGRDRRASLEHALRHSGLPILMTGLTTSAGLGSFFVAEMKPIQEMGMISSLGVGVMLVYSLGMLPSLLAVLPIEGRPARPGARTDRLLAGLATVSARHPRTIVAAVAGLTVLALVGIARVTMSSNPVSWFPEDHEYSIASDLQNRRFGGQTAVEVVIDTGRVDGIKEPRVMQRIEALDGLVDRYVAEGAKLTHSSSVVDIVKETHQALNRNDPAYYRLPEDGRLLAQELLLFENSGNDDLEKLVDSQFSKARYTLRSSWTDGAQMAPFLRRFEPALDEAMGDVATVEVTGMSQLISRTIIALYESLLQSYGLALGLITPLMILLIGSLRSGLVSMVPNLVPIAFTVGMMGFVGIPLDMFTLLAGAIAIGLAVDDSIHFISGFRRELARGRDPVRAVEETMQSTGRALLFTSIVLTSGFGVLMLSEMLNLRNVGALTCFAIATAFLLDVTVTPALLVLTHRREQRARAGAAASDQLAA